MLPRLAAFYLVVVCALFLGRHELENTWVGALLVLGPPATYLVPVAGLALPGLWRKSQATLFFCLLTACLVAFAWMGLQFRFRDGSPAELRVLTYNVFASRKGGLQALVQALRAADPDICLLQECSAPARGGVSDPWPDLQRAFPDWHWARADKQAELVCGSRFPIQSTGVGAGGSELGTFNLGPLRAGFRCQVNTSRGPVICYNVHLSTSYKGTLFGSGRQFREYLNSTVAIRRVQYEILCRELAHEKAPVLLGGDFNTPPTSTGPERLAQLLKDAFACSGQGFGFTYSNRRRLWRIDYLYCSSAFTPVRCSAYDAGASDHLAVLGEFRRDRNPPGP